jgi:protein-S-isoprenylcysteine O-methyltransferase Ste14
MMRPVDIAADTKAALLAAAVMFLWALLLGVWKYRRHPRSTAHIPTSTSPTERRSCTALPYCWSRRSSN